MNPRYEEHVRNARRRLADATRGTSLPGGTTGPYGRYKRVTHYARIVAAQDAGIHKICLVAEAVQICTCGLRVPAGSVEVFEVSGHLDMRSWQPIELLVAECESHTEVFKRRYAVVCHRCSSTTAASTLNDAQSALTSHSHID